MLVLCTWLHVLSFCLPAQRYPYICWKSMRWAYFVYISFKVLYHSSQYLTRLVKLQIFKCNTSRQFTYCSQDISKNQSLALKRQQRNFIEIYCLFREWLQLLVFTSAVAHSKDKMCWKQSKCMADRRGIMLLVWNKWPPSLS